MLEYTASCSSFGGVVIFCSNYGYLSSFVRVVHTSALVSL